MSQPAKARWEDLQRAWMLRYRGANTATAEHDPLATIERDAKVVLRQASTNPPWLAIESAVGAFLRDVRGEVLLDLHGNNCHHIGYAHPDLIQALSDQMANLPFVPRGLTNREVVAAAEQLAALWPYGPSVVAFVPGGSAAVELAIMLCRAHTGRFKTISFYGAYHGRSAGALSLGGRPADRSPRLGPLLPGALHVRPFYPLASEHSFDAKASAWRSFEDLRHCLEQEGGVAAVFVEPVRNGPFVPPDWYWPAVRELCDRHGTLFVADEIPTGLGKTGRMFATEHFDLRPDITLVGKSLGGATVPVAAVIASAALNTTADLNLGYFTYERSPLMAKAASVVLDIIVRDDLVGRSARVGAAAARKLQQLAARQPAIQEVRAAGLMLGVRVAAPNAERSPTLAHQTFQECMRRGLLLQYPSGARLMLSFPLIVDETLVDQSLDVFAEAVDAAVQSIGSVPGNA